MAVDAATGGRLTRAMAHANIPTLVAVLYQLTGERRWLSAPYAPSRGKGMDDNRTGGLPEAIQVEIRAAAVAAVQAWQAGRPAAAPRPSGAELSELLSACMGEEVAPEFEPMMAETLGLRPVLAPHLPPGTQLSALVIGAGVSGLAAAIALRDLGATVTVIEKDDDVGGTWLENSYPGAGVDTPSYLYSLSYFPRAWSTHFAKRDEVHAYLRDLADHYDLRPLIRFDTEVTGAAWDDGGQRWEVATSDGQTWHADVVISATGVLNRPRVPDLPGIDRFAGPIFHSARWPADLDVTGRRVAVVGTGASAMQIVPAIVDRAASVTVFQRSPQWVAPNADYFKAIGGEVHWLMDHVPWYRAWYRARLAWTFNDKVHPSLQVDPDWSDADRSINAVNDGHRRFFTRYLEQQLEGRPDLVAKALPSYPPFGKRMLLDNGWYAALRREHVELVTEAVAGFDETGVRTVSGGHRGAEVVVLCTGFEARRYLYPMQVRGRSGRALHEVWGPEDAVAHLGITVPDFPNLFLLLGPNTALGHGGSAITISEFQIRYITELLAAMAGRGVRVVECRPEVEAAYTRRVDETHNHMIWSHPGMNNWYRNPAGRVVSALPWRIVDYRAMTARADLDDYLTDSTEAAPVRT